MGNNYFSISDLICVAPAIFLFLGSLLPLTIKVLNGNREPSPVLSVALAGISLIAALAVTALWAPTLQSPSLIFSAALVFDGVSVFSTILILIITGFALILVKEHVATKENLFSETLFLLMNSALGMVILALANDLIVVFIGIEIMSLCLYLLIAVSREEKFSKEAAFKYFILGSLASAIFLYGIAFIYGIAGTTYIHEISAQASELISSNLLFLVGASLTILGFCFKASIAPFHAWAPDVYSGAPTPITAFMATGVKLVTFVAFLRFIRGDYISDDLTGNLVTALQWFSVLTMLVGNIAAIVQENLKRMLAYSSIAHSGYIMMGLIASGVGGEGWRGDLGVMFYVFAYSVMTLGAFAFVSLLEKHEDDQVLVSRLSGLGQRSPFLAAVFSLFLLSLAGIPPLVGFFGKFFLFSAVIKQGLFWLAIWAAVNSVISAYYYLRPIVYMYMKDETVDTATGHKNLTYAMVGVLGALVVVLGIFTEPIYQRILQAISAF